MKILLKGGCVLNVFTDEIEEANVLIDGAWIAGVGDYRDSDADLIEDVSGKIITPGLIDGHIHIESSHLLPAEFCRGCLPHGTTTLVADPHEIVNVCGADGMDFMLQASEGIPITMYMMVPSCVPSTPLDESGAVFTSDDISPYYDKPRVLGLAEMMNYPGVLADDPEVLRKIRDARRRGKVVNGHAPLLTGKDLDRYISAGIFDDHECSSEEEAKERLRKGQWVMIRNGTAARNLEALINLFDEPFNRRCLLVTDDKQAADLLANGHIDSIIRQAVSMGKDVKAAFRMASLQAAQCFGIRGLGAVSPGYEADLLVLDDLESIAIRDVYQDGRKVVKDGKVVPFHDPGVDSLLFRAVSNTFNLRPLVPEDFHIEPEEGGCRVIRLIPKELLTEQAV